MAKSAQTTKTASKPASKTAKKHTTKPAKAAAKPSARPAAKKAPAKPATKAPIKSAPKVAAKPPAKPAKPAKDIKPAKDVKDAKTAGSPKPGAKPAAAAPPDAAADKKGPKGITVVQPKVVKKSKPKVKLEMPHSEPLIKPGMKWKPLIPSGPKAPPSPYGVWRDPDDVSVEEVKIDPKARLPKKELDRYREILLRKRAELFGDITGMEREALNSGSGSLSSLPQHMAEQGSDTYDQHLSLDLAAVDRELIKEIDEALSRIDSGMYGICLKTGKRIAAERLNEIPWARYSIQAAREMERTIHLPSSVSSASESSANADMD